jgi:hypothetical protein
MKRDLSHPNFSLLFPSDQPQRSVFRHWGKNTPADLGLETLSRALSYQSKYEPAVRAVLLEFCSDAPVILYRQEVLADFLAHPELAARFAEVLLLLSRLHDYAGLPPVGREKSVHQTLERVSELNAYLNCVRQLREVLQAGEHAFHSRGLKELGDWLAQLEADEAFQSLSKNLPELVARLNGIPSITIGVNLDSELRPAEAMLLSINDKPFKEGSLLDKLVGRRQTRKEDQGIGPLHSVANDFVTGIDDRIVPLPTRGDPLMVPLFRDLHQILKTVLNPIAAALRQYTQIPAALLLPLENEIAFYLGAAALIQKLQSRGLPMCRPAVLPMAARVTRLDGMYNLLLGLHRLSESEAPGAPVVPNDVDFGPAGRIFILTGPNQGGKTVYTQAVGLAQLLFQAGLHVPAQAASLSPLDGIYTHFATEEEFNSRRGRLSEEALHLNEIFQTLTRHSLVLLNESLSSTSPRESFYLSLDIVRALRLYEARAIFATHLHELAEDLETLNAEGSSDSRVVSLVAGVEQESEAAEPENRLVARTYQIKPGPPRGLSYAKGIARQYGISFEQLATLRKR